MNNIPFRGSNRSWAMQGALPTMYQQPSAWDMARKQQSANPWGGSQQAVADPWGQQPTNSGWGQMEPAPTAQIGGASGFDPMNPSPSPYRADNTFQNIHAGNTYRQLLDQGLDRFGDPFQAQQQVYSSPYNQGYQTAMGGRVSQQQAPQNPGMQNTMLRFGNLSRMGFRR